MWNLFLVPGIRLELLRQLADISPNQETPSTQSLAMLAFLYLLTHIYEERLRYSGAPYHIERETTVVKVCCALTLVCHNSMVCDDALTWL